MVRIAVGIAEVTVGEGRDDVRRRLLERQRKLLNEIQSRVRDVREVGANNHHHTTDERDTVEAEPEDDLAFALIEMKAELLERVNEAICHFDEGAYGFCVEGGGVAANRYQGVVDTFVQ